MNTAGQHGPENALQQKSSTYFTLHCCASNCSVFSAFMRTILPLLHHTTFCLTAAQFLIQQGSIKSPQHWEHTVCLYLCHQWECHLSFLVIVLVLVLVFKFSVQLRLTSTRLVLHMKLSALTSSDSPPPPELILYSSYNWDLLPGEKKKNLLLKSER